MFYICADDYGMTKLTCERIEECIKHGALNKVSVLPNAKHSTNVRERIPCREATVGLHLNLVEGKPVSPSESVKLLVRDDGYFRYSFVGLFAKSLLPFNGEFREQIQREIKAQIRFWCEHIAPGERLEIDSHQHTHMIPLVFRTLMRVLDEENLKPDYIRIPSEPILPYILTPSLYFTYSPINIIKQWLLKLLGAVNRRELKGSVIKTAMFMGVMFSGNMDEKRVNKVLAHYIRFAERHGGDIELLFHPGYINFGEDFFDRNKTDFLRFYLSPGRKTEYDTLRRLKVDKNFERKAENGAVH